MILLAWMHAIMQAKLIGQARNRMLQYAKEGINK